MNPIQRFHFHGFLIATALLGSVSLAAHAVAGYVRVNLVRYETGLSARAYLMTTSAVSGVCSAGFSTTVHPAESAGPSFHAAISSGKFHGIIWPTTPTGSRTV